MAHIHNKLHGRIVEKYGTCTRFAEAANCCKSTVSTLLDGKHSFTSATIEKWAKLLDIPKKEYGDYFFT